MKLLFSLFICISLPPSGSASFFIYCLVFSEQNGHRNFIVLSLFLNSKLLNPTHSGWYHSHPSSHCTQNRLSFDFAHTQYFLFCSPFGAMRSLFGQSDICFDSFIDCLFGDADFAFSSGVCYRISPSFLLDSSLRSGASLFAAC